MKLVKSLPKYKCDFCRRRGIKRSMEAHEKICWRNPKRYCELCANTGKTAVDDEGIYKEDCYYCSQFNEKKKKEIEEREAGEAIALSQPQEEVINPEEIPF